MWFLLLNNKNIFIYDNYRILLKNSIDLVNNQFFLSIFLYCFLYMMLVSLNLPFGLPMSILGGFLFGQWVGGLLILLSSTTGALIVFLIARYFFSDFINRKFLKKIQKLKSYFQKNDIEFMLLIRLVPILPYFAQNLLLAVIGTTVFKFYFTTVIGQLPWSIIYASIGSGINSLTFEDINLFEEVFNNPKYLFPIIFILLLIMISFYFRKKISKFRE